ncbi:MAG: CDP-alcohol phosphatidyltransferase family protein [Eubacteriales bacterium]|nr:CDP-alcohol phosphatidyltransferase family protein [Eubacteriales bacterium]
MKNLANGITVSRMAFALALLFVPAFSAIFWVLYACGCISDVLDGVAARALNQKSELGAKLDSFADCLFIGVLLLVTAVYIPIPAWLWVFTGIVAFLRIAAYAVGFYKFRTFLSLHTYANKATGLLLALLPVLTWATGIAVAGGVVCTAALLSALEELALIVTSKTPDRDRKGLLFH